MSAIVTAMRGKGSATRLRGPLRLLRRAEVICGRYGLTSAKMVRTLDRFVEVLGQYRCGATFPITTAAFARHSKALEKYRAQDIELAVHGYRHVDHTRLSLDAQVQQLTDARRLFDARSSPAVGFRSPYLRWSAETIAAAHAAGFLYDSSWGLVWDVAAGAETASYRHVLAFYRAAAAAEYPALPRLEDGLVRIPYCLPDDESLVDRLRLAPGAAMSDCWLAILDRSHELGELFTLGLHPERIRPCEVSLADTLAAARAKSPAVWIARLDEIARWWVARTAATVTIAAGADGEIAMDVEGPAGVTILARNVELLTPAEPWEGAWRIARGSGVRFRAGTRPFIGVSGRSSGSLVSFLRQQGYVVERADSSREHGLYFDRPAFSHEDERGLLVVIERSPRPLVRLGRWPNGSRSALCVTGDIDALTIGDYGLRLFGG